MRRRARDGYRGVGRIQEGPADLRVGEELRFLIFFNSFLILETVCIWNCEVIAAVSS